MTPEYYLSQLKAYSRFVRNFNPAQQPDPQRMLKIAVGPGGDGPRWTEWTDTVMKAWQGRSWSWDIDGLSLHNYTVVKWPPSYKSIGFGETEYARDPEVDTRDGPPHRDPLGDHGQVRPAEEDRAGRRRVGGVVRAAARQQPGLPRPAEQPARRRSGGAQPQHLRAPRRPRAHGEHRPDGQRAAGDDPDGQGEDGPHADVPRVQDVRALPGRHLRAGQLRRRHLHAAATSPCRASTRSPRGTRPASSGWP